MNKLCVVFLLLAVNSFMMAQSPGGLDSVAREQEETLRREQLREKERLREFQERSATQTKFKELEKLDESQNKDQCFKFKKIELKGAVSLNPDEISKLTSSYLNRCVNVVGINNLMREVTNLYVSKGHVTTRTYMTAQDLNDGLLEVLVVEAKVKSLQIIENGKPRKSGRNSFPKVKGEHLNIRSLEQGIDQINRLTQIQAKIDIRPSKSSGETDVVVNSQAKIPEYARITYDNHGQSSTGKEQYNLTFGLDDVLGLYESVYVSLRTDGDFDETDHFARGVSGGFSLPFGFWTINGSASYFKYFNTIRTPNQSFKSDGISRNYRLSLDRVLHRSGDSKTNLSIWGSLKDSDNYIEGSRLDTSSRRLSHLGLSVSHTRKFLGGSFNASLGYERGVRFFGSLKDPANLGINDPVAQSQKFTLSLGYYKPLTQNLALSFQGSGQWSHDTLFGTERFGLGGLYSVRGFRDQSITGDRGGYLRTEFIQYLPMLQSWGQFQTFMAFDIGFIQDDNSDALEGGVMQGIALGAKLSGRSYSIDLSIEKNTNSPIFINENTGIYRLKFTKTF